MYADEPLSQRCCEGPRCALADTQTAGHAGPPGVRDGVNVVPADAMLVLCVLEAAGEGAGDVGGVGYLGVEGVDAAVDAVEGVLGEGGEGEEAVAGADGGAGRGGGGGGDDGGGGVVGGGFEGEDEERAGGGDGGGQAGGGDGGQATGVHCLCGCNSARPTFDSCRSVRELRATDLEFTHTPRQAVYGSKSHGAEFTASF